MPDSKHNSSPLQISLWSGPRNVSTALMYSFAQRSDCQVIDEPLYAHYLRVSGAPHPGREEVLESMDADGDAVMAQLLSASTPKPIVFSKHMAHHLRDLDERFLLRTVNVLLIRDPADMLPSLTIQLPEAKLADTGLARQHQLFEQLRAADQPPHILDSKQLLSNPRGVLSRLCENLNFEFDEAMLQWPAGARAEDGVWAKHWYHAVHKSTGFDRYRPKTQFPSHLLALLEECKPYYDALYAHAIRA